MSIVLAGFLLGMSLIVAMGPQNILLIKQGIRREGITAVILVCLVSDVLLFTAGALGVGVITEFFPLALDLLRWLGVVYLGWFAIRSFRDALRPRGGDATVIDESEPDSPTPPPGTRLTAPSPMAVEAAPHSRRASAPGRACNSRRARPGAPGSSRCSRRSH